MAEAKKNPNWKFHSDDAKVRIKLAVEIYRVRNLLDLSQQELAKRAKTTQRIISKIEDGSYNVGIDLLARICKALHFNKNNFSFFIG